MPQLTVAVKPPAGSTPLACVNVAISMGADGCPVTIAARLAPVPTMGGSLTVNVSVADAVLLNTNSLICVPQLSAKDPLGGAATSSAIQNAFGCPGSTLTALKSPQRLRRKPKSMK